MIKYSAGQLKRAKLILGEIFAACGRFPSLSPVANSHAGTHVANCKVIVRAIVDRDSFDDPQKIFNAASAAISEEAYDSTWRRLYQFKSVPRTYNGKVYFDQRKRFATSEDEIATAITWFIIENKLFYDNTQWGQQINADVYQTILGKLLFDNSCMLVAYGGVGTDAATAHMQAPAPTPTQTTTAAKRTATTKVPGAAPQIGYKASGAHSADIPNLLSTNGKEFLHGNVYCIIADKLGKNTPNAYITPLKVNAAGIVKVHRLNAEKVSFGSGNGYTDCMLFFEDAVAATTMTAHLITKFGQKYANIRVLKDKPAANGYFKVSTEFGPAYIKASKLNEELDEALEADRLAAETARQRRKEATAKALQEITEEKILALPDSEEDIYDYWLTHSD